MADSVVAPGLAAKPFSPRSRAPCRFGLVDRLYLSPGMFGFGRLATYDYFAHVERALVARLRARGHDVVTHVAHVSPTASIRRRALKLTELVANTCDPTNPRAGPIHLIGHSTGGLHP